MNWDKIKHTIFSCTPFFEKVYYDEDREDLQVVHCSYCGKIYWWRCPKTDIWESGKPCPGCYSDDPCVSRSGINKEIPF